jgi:hypothetical protein
MGSRLRPEGRHCLKARQSSTKREKRLVAYLVILVLVAVLGITRLWIQQRRELSQLDTIDGFSSALEAIRPEMPASRPPPTSKPAAHSRAPRKPLRALTATRRTRSARTRASGRGLLSWFVARPKVERARRIEARRRIDARRAGRDAALSEARRRYRSSAPRRRDIAYETIDLTDEPALEPQRGRPPYESVPVAATQTSYTVRYRHPSR